MKINTIRLAAYGPFTDVTVDLAAGGSDFHMIFGPNEAGKSSALRALRNMLFGIPIRTTDNFIHNYSDLRIGAKICRSDGAEIEFLRRKARTKTLRGPDDESLLDDDALKPFLGGVSREVFEQMFAIGHEEMVQGGEEIVSGKGGVGESLFAAGAGLIQLHAAQHGLEQACGALFKPSGSTPDINRAISDLKGIRKSQKEALLLARTWQEHDHGLRKSQDRMQVVRETLEHHQRRSAKLGRIREALPLIARKKEIDAQLVSFQDVPDLADDFGEKRRHTQRELDMASRDLKRSQEHIENIDQQIKTLPVPESIICSAAGIASLQHDLGSIRKARLDRPGLEGRMRTLQKQAADKLGEIGMGKSVSSDPELNLSPSTIGEIQNLGKAFERQSAKLEASNQQQRKKETTFNRRAQQRQKMPAPADVSALESAVQSALEAGSIEKQLAQMRLAAQALESKLNRSLKRQTLWEGSLAEVEVLPCPSKESIDNFEQRFDASRRRIERKREEKATAEAEMTRIQTELQAIDRSQEVPSESNLYTARSLRDSGWGLIRQTMEGQTPDPSECDAFRGNYPSLPDAFETSMTRADHIADRLRREADQVSRKGLLAAEKNHQQTALGNIDGEIETALTHHADMETEWHTLWEPAGITPLSPREMRAWLADMTSIREKLSGLRSDNTQLEIRTGELTALSSKLLFALEASGIPPSGEPSFSERVKKAQVHLKTQKELQTQIVTADKELFNLGVELEEAAAAVSDLQSALVEWKSNWARQVAVIGLDADASPMAALAVIECIREAKEKISESEILRKRIVGIDRDVAAFENRVGELVDDLAPDIKTEPRERAAELLNLKLIAARQVDSKQQSLKEQLSAAKQDRQNAEKRVSRHTALLESLCREAGCLNPEALVETEKLAQTRKALMEELVRLENRLRGLSVGATVDEFIAGASLVEADGIASELETLEGERQKLESERSTLDQRIGSEKTLLDEMDGSAKAAGFAQKAERILAGIESDVEQYSRYKVASLILYRTIEQYREKHQGSMISRASELFSQMTVGAFDQLRAEYDQKGNPVLVGMRGRSGKQVTVEGMSAGTADQLYLALRLASLEQYLQNSEPLPFVVDDILLRFDDKRALATLDVLAELSTKTQILFFTHHQHLVELAQSSKKIPALLCLHTLG